MECIFVYIALFNKNSLLYTAFLAAEVQYHYNKAMKLTLKERINVNEIQEVLLRFTVFISSATGYFKHKRSVL